MDLDKENDEGEEEEEDVDIKVYKRNSYLLQRDYFFPPYNFILVK